MILLFFLISTAFVHTNAKHGIPLSRYAVFFKNRLLEYDPNATAVLLLQVLFEK